MPKYVEMIHDYFDANIDINELPAGNYTMELQAEGKEYFSRVLVNNKLYKTQVSSYSSEEKTVNIKNNNTETHFAFFASRHFFIYKLRKRYYNDYAKLT